MELRLYTFVNFYLSQIQQGIQSAHAAVDLVRYYTDTYQEEDSVQLVVDWADNHKTMIVLNGGNNADLELVVQAARKSELPWIGFCEDEQSLGGIRTCIAVVVPENVYDAKLDVDRVDDSIMFLHTATDGSRTRYDQNDPKFDLIRIIKSSRLA